MQEFPNISSESLAMAIALLEQNITARISEHGKHIHANNHESLGIITEEYYELIDATRRNNSAHIVEEMIDVATGCIVGAASIFMRRQEAENDD